MSVRSDRRIAEEARAAEAVRQEVPPMEPQEIREGDTSGGQRPSDDKPKLMSTQDCRNDHVFATAMLSATNAIYAKGKGLDAAAWESALTQGAQCAESFVRKLRDGPNG